MAVLLALLIAAVASWQVAANPSHWIEDHSQTCFDHPTYALGTHGAWRADATTIFVVTANGVTNAVACPGAEHTIQV